MKKKYWCLLFFLFFFMIGIFNVDAATYKESDLGIPTLSNLKQSGQVITVSYKSSTSSTICSAMRCGIMIYEDKTDKIYRVSNNSTSLPIKGLQKGKSYAFSVAQYYIDSKGMYQNYKFSAKKLITIPGSSSSTSTSVSTPKLTKVSRYSYNSAKAYYTTYGTISGVELRTASAKTYKSTTSKSSYVYGGLTSGKTYTFSIRAYKTVNGKKYYSKWSNSIKTTVKVPTPTLSSVSKLGWDRLRVYYKRNGVTSGVEIYNTTKGKKYKTTNNRYFTYGSLNSGQKYNFKIRSYQKVNGKYYYSSYTSSKSNTVKYLYKYFQSNYGRTSCGKYMASSGCGPTSMAMVASTLKGKKISPLTLGNYGCSNKTFGNGGAQHGFFRKVAKKYGLNGKWVSKNSSQVIKALESGDYLVIAHMGKGHFTKTGHYIVLTGVRSNGTYVRVQDPAWPNNCKYWKFSTVRSETKVRNKNESFFIVKK